MSKNSDTQKSQRSTLSHHEMKRGLNNWGKGSPSFAQVKKSPTAKVVNSDPKPESVHSTAFDMTPDNQNLPAEELTGKNVGKRRTGRMM